MWGKGRAMNSTSVTLTLAGERLDHDPYRVCCCYEGYNVIVHGLQFVVFFSSEKGELTELLTGRPSNYKRNFSKISWVPPLVLFNVDSNGAS